MTLEQLQSKVRVGLKHRDSFRVDIQYRPNKHDNYWLNWYYLLRCKNVAAYNAIKAWQDGRYKREDHAYTPKQAYQALWDECKAFNALK